MRVQRVGKSSSPLTGCCCASISSESPVLLRTTHKTRCERAGHGRPGGEVDLGASPTLPGPRDDRGAARDHGLIDALDAAGTRVVADSACRGTAANVEYPQRRPLVPPLGEPEGGQRRPRPTTDNSELQLKSQKVLRRVRGCPCTTRHCTETRRKPSSRPRRLTSNGKGSITALSCRIPDGGMWSVRIRTSRIGQGS